jgi:glycosyltransferase involved in cell wall biosynthesis/SAM-dependent methyltransferase
VDVRILIVSSYPPDRCGIAAYTVQVAASLRRQGHTVEILSRLPSAAHHQADLHTLGGVRKAIALSRRFDRTIIEFVPDLLFRSLRRDHFVKGWPGAAMLLSRARNVEVVVHEAPYEHLQRARGSRGRVLRTLWHRLLRMPGKLLVHTAWERDQLARATSIPRERIGLLDHGDAFIRHASEDRELARRQLGLEAGGFHLLSIGFLQPHKGFDRAVRALPRLAGQGVRLHVVGSTRVDSPEVMGYVQDLRNLCAATPGVTLHEGYVSDEAFDRWIVACDALVLPYRAIWSSGVLERAKLYDRPAIVSDAGGMRDQAAESTRIVRDDEELAVAMAEVAGVGLQEAPAVDPAAHVALSPDTPMEDGVLAIVRQRASALRRRFEPVADAGDDSSAPGLPAPAVLPRAPAGSGPKNRALQVVNKLTRWELVPIVNQLNELRAYVGRQQMGPALLQQVGEHEEKLRQLALLVDDVRGSVAWQRQLRAEDRTELNLMLSRLQPMTAVGEQAGGSANGHPEDGERPAEDFRLAAFYEAHQQRFRGTSEEIRRRLEIYVPHARDAATACDGAPLLDIGPGRGEWLQLLRENGIAAYGVDVNTRFVQDAKKAGLDARLEDGLSHLRSLPDASLAAITAFHVVEHIPTQLIVDLVDQSLRTLRVGGLLVLETPNPLNVLVGAAWFNLDPTHVRPIHPLFLEFVLENRGFANVRTLVLHPPTEERLEVPQQSGETVRRMAELINQHFYTGQDFAVLGHRADTRERSEVAAAADGEATT